MRVSHIELAGKKHPLCFSLTASAELDEHFGGLEEMERVMTSGTLHQKARAIDKVLTVLMKCGRTYAEAVGMELPDPIKCSPGDLIDVTDGKAVQAIFSAINSDVDREVEVESKNVKATQGA